MSREGLKFSLRGSRPRQLGAVVAAVALVGAGGWIAGARMESPADAAASHRPPHAGPVTVPVQHQRLNATVVAQGTLEFSASHKVVLGGPVGSVDAGGDKDGGAVQRVTKAPAANTVLHDGDSLMEVSGRPVFVFRGSVPMYRDLGPGVSGDDVRQLQEVLRRVGFDPGGVTGHYGQGTADAVKRFYQSKGYQARQPTAADQAQLSTLRQAVYSAQIALIAAQGGTAAGGGLDGTGDTPDAEASTVPSDAEASTAPSGAEGHAPSGDDTETKEIQLAAAQDQLNAANAALTAFQAGYGTKVPAGEVVFLPQLPVRVDKSAVHVGDTPSDTVATVTGSTVQVQATVPGSEAVSLRKGQKAQVELADGRKLQGTVQSLGGGAASGKSGSADGGSADTSAGTAAPVPITVSPADASTLGKDAGAAVKVTVSVESSDGKVLTVPVAAVATTASGQARVRVLRGGKQVTLEVEPGLSADGQVEIHAGSGLKENDLVVVGR